MERFGDKMKGDIEGVAGGGGFGSGLLGWREDENGETHTQLKQVIIENYSLHCPKK